MTHLKAVLLFVACVHSVQCTGDYWWMNSGAFGSNSVQNNGNNKQGGHNQHTQGGQGTHADYQQNSNNQNYQNQNQNQNQGFNQNNAGNTFQGAQGGTPVCPQSTSCLPPSQCWTPSSHISARVANFLECGNNNVCCPPAPQHTSEDLSSALPPIIDNTVDIEPDTLPRTECPFGMGCVSNNYCDHNIEITQNFTEFTKKEIKKRNLIPCMNLENRMLGVCCNQVELLPQSPDFFQQSADNVKTAELTFEGNVLPATQGLVTSQNQGTCPAINSPPPVEECRGRESDCWSVGQPDVDCIGNALCCYDGCANVCQGAGAKPGLPRPKQNARGQANGNKNRPANNQQPNNNNTRKKNNNSNRQQQNNKSDNSKNGKSNSKKGKYNSNKSEAANINNNNSQDQNHNSGYGGGGNTNGCQSGCNQGSVSPVQPPNPRPVQPTRPVQQPKPVQQKPRPVQQKPRPVQQKPRPVQQRPRPAQQYPAVPAKPVRTPRPAQQPRPVQQQRPAQNQQQANFVPSQQKPYTQCPAAMKCVPRVNCDFEGVMTNEVFNLTPQLEMLRVPLIPCVNRMQNNAIDVCCRDPNYKDPWPDMNGNNNNNNGNNGFNNGNNGNNFQGNQNNQNSGNNRNNKKKNGYGK